MLKSDLLDIFGPTHTYNVHSTGCQCFFCQVNCNMEAQIVDLSIDLEMAGTKRANISVKFVGSDLEIKWTSRHGVTQTRHWATPEKLYDRSKISCTYQDGLLSVRIPAIKPKPAEKTPPQEIHIDIK